MINEEKTPTVIYKLKLEAYRYSDIAPLCNIETRPVSELEVKLVTTEKDLKRSFDVERGQIPDFYFNEMTRHLRDELKKRDILKNYSILINSVDSPSEQEVK